MRSVSTRMAVVAIAIGMSVGVVTSPPARADDEDPGVARIGLLHGEVAVKRADSGDTLAAAINAPLSVGDYLSTQSDARTELELDDRTVLRVGENTQLRFTTMTPSLIALQLAQGTVELRLFNGTAAHPEIDTPNTTIRPGDNGRYRVTVDASGDTFVTARSGAVDVLTQSATQTLESGTTLEITGDGANAAVRSLAAAPTDAFDGWNADRDRYEASIRSYAYTDPNIVGTEDLDRYGSWSDMPGYGEVWHPSYASDWAPYHDGRWVWEPFYGWTWVSAEPWGWAPYHYGRWFYANNGWFWYPAVAYETPIYRPALVAFFSFGFGSGGIGAGFGNIGWVPLAPREAFNPWWGRGYGRSTVVNVTNITNVTNVYHYHNIGAPGGAIAIDNGRFASGNFSHPVAVTSQELHAATAVRGIVPVVPTHDNLAYAHTAAPVETHSFSPHFERFTNTKSLATVRPFAEQAAAVRTLTLRQYPTHPTTAPAPAAYRSVPQPARANAGSSHASDSASRRLDTLPATRQTPTQAWSRFTPSPRTAPANATPLAQHSQNVQPLHANADTHARAPQFPPPTQPQRAERGERTEHVEHPATAKPLVPHDEKTPARASLPGEHETHAHNE